MEYKQDYPANTLLSGGWKITYPISLVPPIETEYKIEHLGSKGRDRMDKLIFIRISILTAYNFNGENPLNNFTCTASTCFW